MKWCARKDLNLHTLRYQILSLARLPFRHVRESAHFLTRIRPKANRESPRHRKVASRHADTSIACRPSKSRRVRGKILGRMELIPLSIIPQTLGLGKGSSRERPPRGEELLAECDPPRPRRFSRNQRFRILQRLRTFRVAALRDGSAPDQSHSIARRISAEPGGAAQ